MIDLKVDGHVHTEFCHHAVGAMEEYVIEAVKLGLKKIIFLEHLEAGIKYPETTWLSEEDFEHYFEQGRQLQEKFHGRIEVGLGVEVGYNPARVEEILLFLRRHQWNQVGISYHYMEVGGEHYNVVSRKQRNIETLGRLGIEKAVADYFKTLTEAVGLLPGTVVCHLDAVLRYHPQICFTAEHFRLIDLLLEEISRNNMAIEVNSSGFRIRDLPFPSPVILKKAIASGIKLIAGSDAHRPEDVGRYFDRLAGIMANSGE